MCRLRRRTRPHCPAGQHRSPPDLSHRRRAWSADPPHELPERYVGRHLSQSHGRSSAGSFSTARERQWPSI